MKCPNCGAENVDRSAFCQSCGNQLPVMENLAGQENSSSSQTESSAAYTQSSAQQPTQQTPSSEASPYSNTPPAYQQPAAAASANRQTIYVKGCVASAWDDINKSEGWFGKTLLLGLLYMIPILNFVVIGYCMRWARQLPMGKIASMPKDLFGNRNFVDGFYGFVIMLVFSLVCGIAGSIIGLVPIIGWLAGMVLVVLMQMFMNVAIMRTAVADRLGAGFDLSQIWYSFKSNMGSLFCISFVPGAIIAIVVSIIAMMVIMISLLSVGGDLLGYLAMADPYGNGGFGYGPGSYNYSSYGYYPDSLQSLMIFAGIFATFLPALLIIYVVGCIATAFQYVLVYRAMGHWVARYASDWMNDPTVTATAYRQ